MMLFSDERERRGGSELTGLHKKNNTIKTSIDALREALTIYIMCMLFDHNYWTLSAADASLNFRAGAVCLHGKL